MQEMESWSWPSQKSYTARTTPVGGTVEGVSYAHLVHIFWCHYQDQKLQWLASGSVSYSSVTFTLKSFYTSAIILNAFLRDTLYGDCKGKPV